VCVAARALAIAILGAAAHAQTPTASAKIPAVRDVELSEEAGSLRVVVHADGALPVPMAGTAENPPRMYFDFANVSAPAAGLRVKGRRSIRQARLALNRTRPLVTRLVLDLSEPLAFRLDETRLPSGTLVIVIDSPGSDTSSRSTAAPASSQPPPRPSTRAASSREEDQPIAVPVPRVVDPPPTGTDRSPAALTPLTARGNDERSVLGSPSSSGALPKVPTADARRYLSRASVLLARLETLRPLLVSLDARADLDRASLAANMRELDEIATALASLRPPARARDAHARVLSACQLASLAARTRLGATAAQDANARWNAASAAAGALILFSDARRALNIAEATK
jgi:hypothetical protein